jgi:exodeoxyribonuclease V beta subunit
MGKRGLINSAAGHELWRDNGFMRMLRDWLDWAGAAGQSVAERLLAQADGERRLTNLLHLAELLQQESRQRSGIEPLLAWFDRAVNDPQNSSENTLVRLESDASRVQIVTIHSSKGLEYPLVFCPWLWEGAPQWRRRGGEFSSGRCRLAGFWQCQTGATPATGGAGVAAGKNCACCMWH